LRSFVFHRGFEVQDYASHAGLGFGHTDALQQLVAHYRRLHALHANARLGPEQVEKESVGIEQLVGAEVELAVGLDGDAGDFGEGPEPDSGDFELLSMLEIADRLRCTVPTVNSRLFRGRSMLLAGVQKLQAATPTKG
jgi:hypothetical protein